MVLQIGSRERRIGAGEYAKLTRRHRHRPRLIEKILQCNRCFAQKPVGLLIEGWNTGDLVGATKLEMVLQVLANIAPFETPSRCLRLARRHRGRCLTVPGHCGEPTEPAASITSRRHCTERIARQPVRTRRP